MAEVDITKDLQKFNLANLDAYEQMQYAHTFKSFKDKAEALQILINNVEGDYSQLSEELSKLAEKQNRDYSDEYAKGGNIEQGQLSKIKSAYDFGSEYYEGDIYGQCYKIRMNKNHPRNSSRNDDQFVHNLSLINVSYPSAVIFRESFGKLQWQFDKVYDWGVAKESIEEFFFQLKDISDEYAKGGNMPKEFTYEIGGL